MPIVYATISDVASAPGGNADDDTEAMLEFASDMVTHACRNDWYAIDNESKPTQDFVLDAMKRATIAQIIAWQQAKITLADLYAGQATVSVTKTKSNIGSGGIERDAGAIASQDAARVGLVKGLGPRSMRILRQVNLATSAVGLW